MSLVSVVNDLRRLRLEPGDVLVVTGVPDSEATLEQMDRLSKEVERWAGRRHLCVFAPPGADVSLVATRAAVAEALAPFGWQPGDRVTGVTTSAVIDDIVKVLLAKTWLPREAEDSLRRRVESAVARAAAGEREACAALAEAEVEPGWDELETPGPEGALNDQARRIAAAIRARGQVGESDGTLG